MQVLHVQSNNYLLFLELPLEEENKVSVLFYNQDNRTKVGYFTVIVKLTLTQNA